MLSYTSIGQTRKTSSPPQHRTLAYSTQLTEMPQLCKCQITHIQCCHSQKHSLQHMCTVYIHSDAKELKSKDIVYMGAVLI